MTMTEMTATKKTRLFPKFSEDREQLTWDSSSLGRLHRCARLYKLDYVDGWRRPRTKTYTSRGHALHTGLESLDISKFQGATGAEALDVAIPKVLNEFGPVLKEVGDNKISVETILRTLVWWVEERWFDGLTVATLPNGNPALEVRVEVPIPGLDRRFSAYIDKISTWNDDQLWIVDTKTTKNELDRRFFSWFSPDDQQFSYVWVCRRVLGIPVRGYIIDGLQVLVHTSRFKRQRWEVSDDQLDEWLAKSIYRMKEAQHFHKTNFWPQNFEACSSKGGCSFQSVCAEERFMRQALLEANFICEPYQGSNQPPDVEPPTNGQE